MRRRRLNRESPRQAGAQIEPADPNVRLEALKEPRPAAEGRPAESVPVLRAAASAAPAAAGRDREAAARSAGTAAAAAAAAGPPPPPKISLLKFIGFVDGGRARRKVAAFSDCRATLRGQRRGHHRRPVPPRPDRRRVGRHGIPRRPRPRDDSHVGTGLRHEVGPIATGAFSSDGVPVLKHRLIVGIVLALLVVRVRRRPRVPQGAGSVPRRRLGHGGRRVHQGRPGEPGQGGVQDHPRARDADRVAGAHHARARARAEGSARRGAARVQEGARARRDQPARPAALGGAREDDSRSHRGDAPEAADRRAARPGAPRGARRCSARTAPLPVVSFGPNASLRDILNFIGTATGINVTYDSQYHDKAYTVRLEDVTLEQALQQIMTANSSSTRSSTRRRSSSSPTTRRSTRSTTTSSCACSTSRTPT